MNKVLGLANRARKLILGTEKVLNGIRNGKVCLVLLSSKASANTKKQIQDKTKFYQVDLLEIDDFKLNQAIGRVGIKVVGVFDLGFKKLILEKEKDVI